VAAIGIGLVWISYTTVLYGYCLFRGYDVTPKQLLSPQWPPGAPQGANKPSSTNPTTNAPKQT